MHVVFPPSAQPTGEKMQLQTAVKESTENPPDPSCPAVCPLLSLLSWDEIERFMASGVLLLTVLRRQ